jgi:hypothetical protein
MATKALQQSLLTDTQIEVLSMHEIPLARAKGIR